LRPAPSRSLRPRTCPRWRPRRRRRRRRRSEPRLPLQPMRDRRARCSARNSR
jgi:hypothetical protein